VNILSRTILFKGNLTEVKRVTKINAITAVTIVTIVTAITIVTTVTMVSKILPHKIFRLYVLFAWHLLIDNYKRLELRKELGAYNYQSISATRRVGSSYARLALPITEVFISVRMCMTPCMSAKQGKTSLFLSRQLIITS